MFSCSELLPFCRSLLKSSLQIRMCKPGGKKKVWHPGPKTPDTKILVRDKDPGLSSWKGLQTQGMPAGLQKSHLCNSTGSHEGHCGWQLQGDREKGNLLLGPLPGGAAETLDRKPPKVTTQKLQEIQTGWREQFCPKGKPLARQVQAHSFTSFKD